MIDFAKATINDKKLYRSFFSDERERGCEYSFANLILWGQQNIATLHGCLLRLSYYGGHIAYAFPLGKEEKLKDALEEIFADAKERNIPCVFMGVYEKDKEILEQLYPDKFRFEHHRDGFDYIYDINDLCDLKGRKFHAKRNHLHRFRDLYPDHSTEVLSKSNLKLAEDFAEQWYKEKLQADPDGGFEMEQTALSKAFRYYDDLEMEGLLLKNGNEVLGFTIGSRLSQSTFDVHFEKAREEIQGAYAAINNEFAKHLRGKFPELRFLNREEDMGIEGLRKAKESYRPHHFAEKYMAIPLEVKNGN